LVAAGVFGGRRAINTIKAWQARHHARKAFAYIERENWPDARSEATAAYQLRSTEPEALRAVARFHSRTHQIEALDFWKQLEERRPLIHQDLRDEAAIAITASELSRAEVAVGKLTISNPEPADWLLAAQLAINQGLPENALHALEKIDSTASDREKFQAALLKLGVATTQEQTNKAWWRMEELSHGQSETALDALVVLARRTLSDERSPIGSTGGDHLPDAAALSHALETHPLAKAAQKLIALDLLEEIDPTKRERLITRAIADWKDSDPSSLVALATWLDGKGEYQRQLDTIPLNKILQNRELFLLHLDALGALNRWEEVKQLLDNDRFPLDPVMQKMYLARCNAKLGEKTAAENNWERALEAAAGDPSKLMTVADYAEKNGELDVATSAYSDAIAEAPKLRAAYQGRLRIAQASRNAKEIHIVLADMLRIWPNDLAVQNDDAYVRLLLLGKFGAVVSKKNGANYSDHAISNAEHAMVDEIEKLAEKLVQKNPASMPHRTLLALARLHQNRAADALDAYANIAATPGSLTPSALYVHAAVLLANGNREEGQAEAAQVKMEDLLPEERTLIAGLRQ
jgi:tetratricopeptide (TPR) repeat protein